MKINLSIPTYVEADVDGAFCVAGCPNLHRYNVDNIEGVSCLLFSCPLESSTKGQAIRCKKCIRAEVANGEAD